MQHARIRQLAGERVPLLVLGAALWGAAALLQGPAAAWYRSAVTIEHTIEQYNSLLAESGNHAVLRDQLAATNDSLHAVLKQLSGGMARASDLSGLLETLINKTKESGISFVSVKPQNAGDAGAACPVMLEFSSTYGSLGRFTALLESQPHLYRVDRLAVNAGKAGSVDVRMMVTVFLDEGRETP